MPTRPSRAPVRLSGSDERPFPPSCTGRDAEAARYYERECIGLGVDFLEAVRRAVEFIKTHPEGAPRVSEDLRRKLIERFPYGLIYAIDREEVFVLAIASLRRRPFCWKNRSRLDI